MKCRQRLAVIFAGLLLGSALIVHLDSVPPLWWDEGFTLIGRPELGRARPLWSFVERQPCSGWNSSIDYRDSANRFLIPSFRHWNLAG